MSWARVDDGWWCHAKVATLSLAARGLWVTALSWCAQQKRSDIPRGVLPMLTVGDRKASALASELTTKGLWDATGDGWTIHDHADYQRESKPKASPEQRAEHAAKAARARWGACSPDAREHAHPMLDACSEHAQSMPGAMLIDAHAQCPSMPRAGSHPHPIPSHPDPDPEFPSPSAEPPVDGVSPQLALTPAPDSESKRQRKPNPKREPTGNPNHRPLQDHYDAEFRRLRGGEPPPFGGREAGAIKRLLDQVGNDLDRAKRIVTHGLSAQLGNPQTIVSIAADPARWTQAPPVPFQRGGGRQGPPQPNSGTNPFHEIPEGF